MDMIGKVRRMRLRDQLSLSEIARRTGLSRNTVKKWLKAPGDVVPKYERVKLDGKLTAFEPALHQALTTDSQPQAHLDRSRDPSLRLVPRTQCLAERAVSSVWSDTPPPSVARNQDPE